MNVSLHRWLTFVIAAFFAGLAGALFALASHNVFPGWLNWTASATPIVMTILGGMHSFVGPIVGSIIYVLMQTWLTGLTEYWALFMGVTIMLLVIASAQRCHGLSAGSQTMSDTMLRLVGLEQSLRRAARHPRRFARCDARRISRHHRPERRRQKHALQSDQRVHAAGQRPNLSRRR